MKPSPAPFEIEHRIREDGIAVIRLAGRIMLGQESARIETLTRELLAAGRRKLILDVSGVTHIDSTGIGRFISSLNQTMQAGGQLLLAGAGGVVRDGFRVTRLDTVFQFAPDVETAATRFR
ncbi:MAG: STAS domain-containing protein [Acidobacteria bacterium]|nr:STAS domain-containing protein [Acidobacteriota bacterium]